MTNLATEEEMGICPRGCGNKEGGFGGTTRVGGRPTGHSSANWKVPRKQLVNSIKAVRISEKWSTRMDEARLEGNYSLSLS